MKQLADEYQDLLINTTSENIKKKLEPEAKVLKHTSIIYLRIQKCMVLGYICVTNCRSFHLSQP